MDITYRNVHVCVRVICTHMQPTEAILPTTEQVV